MSTEPEIPQPNLERRARVTSERIAQFIYDGAAKDSYIEDLLEIIAAKDREITTLKDERKDHTPLTVLKES